MPPKSSRIRWTSQPPEPSPPGASGGARVRLSTPLLNRLGRDLTRLAHDGKLKPLFGRQKELVQLQRILLRKEKNTPLLVGAPGVGKTALVEGLATRVIRGEAAPELGNLRIVEISASNLIAGTELRGSMEKRMQALLAECQQDPDLVLFIDEIHTLVRLGAVEGGALDMANLLKPALARGEIRCIGATTPDEYERFLRAEAAFQRRFEPLFVEEPGEAETIEILLAARFALEAHHRVTILPEAVQAAVRLSTEHILDRYLPDKALDVLDYACTLLRLPDGEQPRSPAQPMTLDAEIISRALAEKLGLPVAKLDRGQSERLLGMEEFLGQRIVGQPLAISRLAAALRATFAGLGKPGQPRGVFAFFGASGVGKTATARALAEFLFASPDALIRLDMSEYKEAHTVARLFGAPPGYVGYTDEGTFASRLRRQPWAVVLLDEIEKAHPEIQDAFLQIFDEGRFSDARGRLVEARQAIFILTSNLFTIGEIDSPDLFDQQAAAVRQSLTGILRPEFVNRLTEIILFQELGLPALEEIARQEINGLNSRLERFGVTVEASEAALEWMAGEAIDPGSGARGLLRLMARLVAEPLSRRLMQGEFTAGQRLELTLKDRQLTLQARA